MKKKLRIGVLFGGVSTEHDVSLMSAKNIVAALDRTQFEPVLIKIDMQGKWHDVSPAELLSKVDVVFPILHGTNGEDGTMQGLLELTGIPYVGAGVLGSAVGMDKDVMKRLLQQAKLPIAHFVTVRHYETPNLNKLVKQLGGFPVFVKPANNGSSVGVSKAKTVQELASAIQKAFSFDNKILIEEAIEGREIECSVLGNDAPTASIPGEVRPTHEFYDYEAKYIDEHGAELLVPAKLTKLLQKKVQQLAIKTFTTLECAGMARVDFFVTKRGRVLVNEINTIPGFTSISMYPRLWEASGLPYAALITRLIELALERKKSTKKLATTR